jgi:hypothetical protein
MFFLGAKKYHPKKTTLLRFFEQFFAKIAFKMTLWGFPMREIVCAH